jgi:hypothetical protein
MKYCQTEPLGPQLPVFTGIARAIGSGTLPVCPSAHQINYRFLLYI